MTFRVLLTPAVDQNPGLELGSTAAVVVASKSVAVQPPCTEQLAFADLQAAS